MATLLSSFPPSLRVSFLMSDLYSGLRILDSASRAKRLLDERNGGVQTRTGTGSRPETGLPPGSGGRLTGPNKDVKSSLNVRVARCVHTVCTNHTVYTNTPSFPPGDQKMGACWAKGTYNCLPPTTAPDTPSLSRASPGRGGPTCCGRN